MPEIDCLPAVKQGYWFYAGVTLCPVRIVQHNMLFGTGDPEDPPDIAIDRITDCFYVRYHPPGSNAHWLDGGTALSLREAVFLAQRKLGPAVQWND